MSTLTVRLPGDKHSRFKALAASANIENGLKLLDKLDSHFEEL